MTTTFRRFRVGSIGVYPKAGRTRNTPEGARESYWEARRVKDGRRVPVWSGWATREGAERQVAELALLAPEERPEIPGSVAFLLAGWLAGDVLHRGDLADATRKAYQRDANHLVEGLGHRRASTLSTAALAEYRDARLAAGAATGTVRQELKRIAAAWAWAPAGSAGP